MVFLLIFHVQSLSEMQMVTEFFKDSSRNAAGKSSQLHLMYQQQPFVPQCLLVLAVFCDIGHAYKSVDHKKDTRHAKSIYQLNKVRFIWHIETKQKNIALRSHSQSYTDHGCK